ncbi:MAG: hypothetical protein BWY42_01588 [Candidatus Omnitrophica bacterium ADurb.Bin277]|nr:MAG: hypothetical protein BWY42_01588 [Candidatus Omnitrophica bacterium ADurb.Bin277]
METDLNAVPSANRVHIGFFGRRNAGDEDIGPDRTRGLPYPTPINDPSASMLSFR